MNEQHHEYTRMQSDESERAPVLGVAALFMVWGFVCGVGVGWLIWA